MEQNNVIVDKKDQIATVTIDSKTELNFISPETLNELSQKLIALDLDETVEAIIIRGSENNFSAGIEVNSFIKNVNSEMVDKMMDDFNRISELKKPTIAAVNGVALGLASQIALSCDIIFASDNAYFGYPDLSINIIPAFGATQLLPKVIGKPKTLEMMLTGKGLTAKQADSYGLISRIVPLKYLFEEADKVAKNIIKIPTSTVITVKELTDTGFDNISLADGLEIERQIYKSAIDSDKFKLNLANFAKK